MHTWLLHSPLTDCSIMSCRICDNCSSQFPSLLISLAVTVANFGHFLWFINHPPVSTGINRLSPMTLNSSIVISFGFTALQDFTGKKLSFVTFIIATLKGRSGNKDSSSYSRKVRRTFNFTTDRVTFWLVK